MRHIIPVLAALLSLLSLTARAHATGLPAIAEENFSNSAEVTDAELRNLRGGFRNGVFFGPVGIDFSFLAKIEVKNDAHNIHLQDQFALIASTLNKAAQEQQNGQNSIIVNTTQNTKNTPNAPSGQASAATPSSQPGSGVDGSVYDLVSDLTNVIGSAVTNTADALPDNAGNNNTAAANAAPPPPPASAPQIMVMPLTAGQWVFQNRLDGTQINFQQVLDIVVQGVQMNAIQNARFNALDMQSISALRGL